MTKPTNASKKVNKPDSSKVEGQLFWLKPSVIAVPKIRARGYMTEDGLKELTASVKKQGIIEPLIVTEQNGKWTLVAGERRLKASLNANLQKVPVLSRSYSPQEALYAELAENLNREDGDPISEAVVLNELELGHAQTHSAIAGALGKHRTWVTNRIRLLELTDENRALVMHGEIDPSSALELLQIEDQEAQTLLGKNIAENDYTRNQVRSLVRGIITAAEQAGVSQAAAVQTALEQAEVHPPSKLPTEGADIQEPERIPERAEQPQPTRELCHGCELPKMSNTITYHHALCSDCNAAVSTFLASRRTALKEATR